MLVKHPRMPNCACYLLASSRPVICVNASRAEVHNSSSACVPPIRKRARREVDERSCVPGARLALHFCPASCTSRTVVDKDPPLPRYQAQPGGRLSGDKIG